MGKTKTAFIGEAVEEKKTSAEKYADKKAKREAEKEKILQVPEVEQVLHDEPKTETPKQKREITEKQRGKKYLEVKSKINKSNLYKLPEAIKLIKEVSYSKFDGTMEMHLVVKKTGVNVNVTLPFSAEKQKKVEIADEKTIEKLKTAKIDFDLLLASAEMMPKLVMFAKLLGPRGLMPNPKNGTIIKSKAEAERFSGNTLQLKTEKEVALIHTFFGKVSQKDEELIKNAETILDKLGGSKTIIRGFLKSTMSPSVKIVI
ncbi:hypothetical protein A2130_01215 [Candidatus Woesebacteria bacterium GWC2_33_12]|uniref:Large ribosomal subunit protein uL1 n=1 Tax=Candidatus Woesebacteria bacterium GW2011_GWB1_33_22 TaxID=1618566 RepID=A0A0G0CPQ6_9BACT|nr:MAG: hypothetical protein UR29_C0002G0132 [Candidatus Woesebacteria bacterium GW2011_GWC2_33_12]KKP42604.1 MAG: hypothetical protein UR33_C0002G0180 [Candidatus Woesebacteria bacterium GW2011_GWA2_33_20]KKP45347.1 MAG: hypothetical protein UR35_C0002G0180 [Candidatus Woesebacteria bacterium GW2011_GWB1_33_22]KKP47175.1 MAG: hypothetical protein UR37_C0002G0087 [Microgenomates group bacterium GW2011_GWC1_33_28]KKP51017.1 MAG: hypothetical protein UR41_C0002G0181 [Candidatus Woesebacteria bact